MPNWIDLLSEIVGIEGLPTSPAAFKRQVVIKYVNRVGKLPGLMPNATAVLNRLRSAGLGIRKTDFLRIYRSTRQSGIMGGQQAIRPLNRVIPRSIMPVAQFPTRTPYLNVININVYDYNTGRWGRKDFYGGSDVALSPADAVQQYFNVHGGKFRSDEVDWSTARFMLTYQRSDAQQ